MTSKKNFEISTKKGNVRVEAIRSEDLENTYTGKSKVWFEYSAFPACFQPNEEDEDQDLRQAPSILQSRVIEGIASSLSKDSSLANLSL